MATILAENPEETILKLQSHFGDLIGYNKLEFVLQGIFSMLKLHGQQFNKIKSDAQALSNLETRVIQLTNRVIELEGQAQTHQEHMVRLEKENAHLSETVQQNRKDHAELRDRVRSLEEMMLALQAEKNAAPAPGSVNDLRDFGELRDTVRAIGERVNRLERRMDSLITELDELRQSTQGFERNTSKKFAEIEKLLDRKVEEDRLTQEFIPRDKRQREQSDLIDQISKRLDRFERNFGIELQGMLKRFDEKMDKNVMLGAEYIPQTSRSDDNGTLAAGRMQYRCLCCNQLNAGFLEAGYFRLDPLHAGQNLVGNGQTNPSTKQFTIMGSDGRMYKGRDDYSSSNPHNTLMDEFGETTTQAIPSIHSKSPNTQKSPRPTSARLPAASNTSSSSSKTAPPIRPSSASTSRTRPTSAGGFRRDTS